MLDHFVGEHVPPEQNKAGRIAFWSRPSRMVKKVSDDPHHVAIIREATVAGIINLDSGDEA
jgi:hypothetical protein